MVLAIRWYWLYRDLWSGRVLVFTGTAKVEWSPAKALSK
jgi:hypothetical protein